MPFSPRTSGRSVFQNKYVFSAVLVAILGSLRYAPYKFLPSLWRSNIALSIFTTEEAKTSKL